MENQMERNQFIEMNLQSDDVDYSSRCLPIFPLRLSPKSYRVEKIESCMSMCAPEIKGIRRRVQKRRSRNSECRDAVNAEMNAVRTRKELIDDTISWEKFFSSTEVKIISVEDSIRKDTDPHLTPSNSTKSWTTCTIQPNTLSFSNYLEKDSPDDEMDAFEFTRSDIMLFSTLEVATNILSENYKNDDIDERHTLRMNHLKRISRLQAYPVS